MKIIFEACTLDRTSGAATWIVMPRARACPLPFGTVHRSDDRGLAAVRVVFG